MSPKFNALIVDDEETIQQLFATVIADMEGESATASNGRQAYQLATAYDYDVILMDLGLPDSHGINAIIQTREQAPETAIVVLTGLEDEALALEALRQGAQDYLAKAQIAPQLLVRSMRYAIERKRGEEQIRKLNEDLELRVLERTTELEAIQASMTEGLVALDSRGQIVTFNQAAVSISGVRAEEVLGRSAEVVLNEFAPAIENQDAVEPNASALLVTSFTC